MSESDSRISFNKGYTPAGYADKVFHIHFHRTGDNDEILFRDYLIAHPEVAEEYEGLKLSLLSKYKNNRDGYTKTKTTFIRDIIGITNNDKGLRPCSILRWTALTPPNTLIDCKMVAFPWIRRIYADRGYRGNFIEEARHDFGIDAEITHSNYSGQFVPAKKRWVVERTFARLENFRRLCRNYEETTESANEMLRARRTFVQRALMVATVVITLRKLTSVNNRF